MSRNIISGNAALTPEAAQQGGQEPDNFATQIIKLIPAEIVGVYLGVVNLFAKTDVPRTPPDPDSNKTLTAALDPVFIAQSIVFILILIITPFYLKSVAKMTDNRQRNVATISFIVWGISLGGPFTYLLHDILKMQYFSATTIGSALVAIYTLLVPMLYKPAVHDK